MIDLPRRRTVKADDKSKTDNRDRGKVAGGEDYEVQHFAKEAGISQEQARELIKAYGNNRATLMEALRTMGTHGHAARSSRT